MKLANFKPLAGGTNVDIMTIAPICFKLPFFPHKNALGKVLSYKVSA